MLRTANRIAIVALLAAPAACGSTGEISADGGVGLACGSASITWGRGGVSGGGCFGFTPDPSMIGLCAQLDSVAPDGTVTPGTPTKMKPGPNTVSVPEGGVTLDASFFPWEEEENEEEANSAGTRTGSLGPANPRPTDPPFLFSRRIVLPNLAVGKDNLQHWMELSANSLQQAKRRREIALDCISQVLQELTPNRLPRWVSEIYFSNWKVIASGPNRDDVWLTVAARGTTVREFRLDVNGIYGYADLFQGATITSLGEWQVVRVLIDDEHLNFPSLNGDWFENSIGIEFDTDRSSPAAETQTYVARIDP